MNTPDDTANFFDSHATTYIESEAGMRAFHEVSARRIEASLSGRVLSAGGVWALCDPTALQRLDLAVVDASQAMVKRYQTEGINAIRGDTRALPFADGSFDHVVLPLVLHHITEGSWRAAREQVNAVFREVFRVLAPGGSVWISEFCVERLVYWAQALASPLLKRTLQLRAIPLVVMHTATFYERALRQVGFDEVESFQPRPDGVRWYDVIEPVIGLPWLKVPRATYPVRPTVVSATR